MAIIAPKGVVLVIGGYPFEPAGHAQIRKDLNERLMVARQLERLEIAAAEHDRLYKLGPELAEPVERPKPSPMWRGQQYRRGKRDK